jgi:cephalosporin hydroxylase
MILSKTFKRLKTRWDYRRDPRGKYKANLTGEYKSLFRYMKFKKIKLLELGIDYGGSLLFWSDFFIHPKTKITGADIAFPVTKTFPRRVSVVQCDQNDSASLIKIAEEHGPFDIIIDDASHFTKETDNSFKTLIPYVISGGYYIIEDWYVDYMGKEYRGMNDVVANIMLNAPKYSIKSLRIIANISTLACFRGSTAIFRKDA